jgi:hypothetical protein
VGIPRACRLSLGVLPKPPRGRDWAVSLSIAPALRISAHVYHHPNPAEAEPKKTVVRDFARCRCRASARLRQRQRLLQRNVCDGLLRIRGLTH